jgi:hypothetical protein
MMVICECGHTIAYSSMASLLADIARTFQQTKMRGVICEKCGAFVRAEVSIMHVDSWKLFYVCDYDVDTNKWTERKEGEAYDGQPPVLDIDLAYSAITPHTARKPEPEPLKAKVWDANYYCKCGKVARTKGFCFECYKKNRIEKGIEKRKAYLERRRSAPKEKDPGMVLRAFFRRSGHRRYRTEPKESSEITLPLIKKRKSRPFTCSKCYEEKKGRRVFINGIVYCRTCATKVEEKRLAEEVMQTAQAQDTIDKIDPFGEMRLTCKNLGTCDVLHFHHELLKDDPERMSTEFLVGLICGDDKAERYKKKKSGD